MLKQFRKSFETIELLDSKKLNFKSLSYTNFINFWTIYEKNYLCITCVAYTILRFILSRKKTQYVRKTEKKQVFTSTLFWKVNGEHYRFHVKYSQIQVHEIVFITYF